MLLGPARAGQLRKPLLVIVISDGQPAGEPASAVFYAVMRASDELRRSRVSFRFMVLNDNAPDKLLDHHGSTERMPFRYSLLRSETT